MYMCGVGGMHVHVWGMRHACTRVGYEACMYMCGVGGMHVHVWGRRHACTCVGYEACMYYLCNNVIYHCSVFFFLLLFILSVSLFADCRRSGLCSCCGLL